MTSKYSVRIANSFLLDPWQTWENWFQQKFFVIKRDDEADLFMLDFLDDE